MQSLAEKYRPQTPEELLSQPNFNLIYQLADSYIAPSYLFFGPPGTGKTTGAKLLIAKVENASMENLAKCQSDVIEYNCGMKGGVDDVKELILDKCQTPPRKLSRKYVILDEAQMLSAFSQNSLLNIMEVPPPFLTFILCTTEPKKIIQAVKSRCLQTKFLPGNPKDLEANLEKICRSEKIDFDGRGIAMLAKASAGSFRESIMMLSQYQQIGAKVSNVSQFAGLLSKEEIDNILVETFTRKFDVLIERIKLIQSSNVKPDEILASLLERLNEIIECKILEKSDNSKLYDVLSDFPVLKACDIVYEAIKNITPATPDNLLLQITIYKLAALKKKN
jgi:DNA polymerase III subunit gamma/tau